MGDCWLKHMLKLLRKTICLVFLLNLFILFFLWVIFNHYFIMLFHLNFSLLLLINKLRNFFEEPINWINILHEIFFRLNGQSFSKFSFLFFTWYLDIIFLSVTIYHWVIFHNFFHDFFKHLFLTFTRFWSTRYFTDIIRSYFNYFYVVFFMNFFTNMVTIDC